MHKRRLCLCFPKLTSRGPKYRPISYPRRSHPAIRVSLHIHMAGNSPPVPPTREQILASPAMHAPSGITPDFEHPWSMFYNAIRILISIYLISTIVVIVRIYERLRIARTFFREDYVIILAWVRIVSCAQGVGSGFRTEPKVARSHGRFHARWGSARLRAHGSAPMEHHCQAVGELSLRTYPC